MAELAADPEVMLADKGYDSDAIRDEVRARGGAPKIPTKKNPRIQHEVNQTLYSTRNRIERFFNKFKNSRRCRNTLWSNRDQLPGVRKDRLNQDLDSLCPRDIEAIASQTTDRDVSPPILVA